MAVQASTASSPANLYMQLGEAIHISDVSRITALLQDPQLNDPSVPPSSKVALIEMAMHDLEHCLSRIRLIKALLPDNPSVSNPAPESLFNSMALAYNSRYISEFRVLCNHARSLLQNGMSLAMLAVSRNQLPILPFLRSCGSDTLDADGNNILHYAYNNWITRYNFGRQHALSTAQQISDRLVVHHSIAALYNSPNAAGVTPFVMIDEFVRNIRTPPGSSIDPEFAEIPQRFTRFSSVPKEDLVCPICHEEMDTSAPVVQLVHPWVPGTHAPREPSATESLHLYHEECLQQHTRTRGDANGGTFDPMAPSYHYKWTSESLANHHH